MERAVVVNSIIYRCKLLRATVKPRAFQFVMESADRVHAIEDYNRDNLESKVIQIEILSHREEIIILTEQSVSLALLLPSHLE